MPINEENMGYFLVDKDDEIIGCNLTGPYWWRETKYDLFCLLVRMFPFIKRKLGKSPSGRMKN
jgi:hypothetical protein